MKYINGEHFTIIEPYLLMKDVVYARCGRSDVVYMAQDASVWTFGTIGYDERETYFFPYSVKILENVALVTGGMFNHAALLKDGSVWTWGYNYSENCGVSGVRIVSLPTRVAENAAMVWTGSIKNGVDCRDISEFEGIYEKQMENTIILTKDGSYFMCGANVGMEEKVLPIYYEVANYPLVCTSEFLPYDWEE